MSNTPNTPESKTPISSKYPVVGGFLLVQEDKRFGFKGLCPYCKCDLFYTGTGWEQDENGLWVADSFDLEYSTDPGVESEEWEDWFASHSDMPYEIQFPVDLRVKEYIKNKYRFDLK